MYLVTYHVIIVVSSVVKITAHNDTFLLLWQRSDLLFDKTYLLNGYNAIMHRNQFGGSDSKTFSSSF
jgi:hypothetical protein